MRKELVFDTNILIYFFEGDEKAAKLLESNEFYISSMTYIELLSSLKMPPQRRVIIRDFLLASTVIQTNSDICDKAAKFRLSYSLKLPDATIAATAQYLGMPLYSADATFFKIKEIQVIPFIK